MRSIVAILLLSCLTSLASAQKGHARIDPNTRGWEVIGIDHVVKDKNGNRMPKHAVPGMTWVAVYSKDGQHCLVSYRGDSYQSHSDFRNDVNAHGDPQLRVFERFLTNKETLEKELKTGDFAGVDLDNFHAK